MFRNFLNESGGSVLLVDGAMGTYLHVRGVPVGHCREAVNLEHPELVRSIHEEYILAGAQIVETNTFGANPFQLGQYGLEDKVRDLNRAGAKLAREAASRKSGTLVAGSIGPLGVLIEPFGQLRYTEAVDAFCTQVSGLLEGGVDLFFIETQHTVKEVCAALEAIKKICNEEIPVVCLLSVDQEGLSRFGKPAREALLDMVNAGADVVGLNCAIGPRDMLEIIRNQLCDIAIPVCAMPNAGYPTFQAGQPVFAAGPEYFADLVPAYVEAGVKLLGSCCGTTPQHTQSMAEALKKVRNQRVPQRETLFPPRINVYQGMQESVPEPLTTSTEPSPLSLNRLLGVKKSFTVEIDPPRGWDYEPILHQIRALSKHGIHAANITDNPMARLRMDASALAAIVKREIGVEPILHYTCRNRNVLAIQSELLGCAAQGVRVVLTMTGNALRVGEFPEATSVKDVDATSLIGILDAFNHGQTLAGNPIDRRTEFIIGSIINAQPERWDREEDRIRKKISNGVHFLVTPPVYQTEGIRKIRNILEGTQVELLAGILPILDLAQATYLHNEIPGIRIPNSFLNDLEKIPPKNQARFAEEYCLQLIDELWDMVDGFCFIPPFRRYESLESLWPWLEAKAAQAVG